MLQNQIEKIETEIDLKSKELLEIYEFGMIPDQVLIEEKNVLLRQLAEIKAYYSTRAAKVITRHDACVKNTNIRCSRIINAAEDNASAVWFVNIARTRTNARRVYHLRKDE